MYIFTCEDSLVGIFTGVYDAWASGHPHEENRLITGDTWNMELFARYQDVLPDQEKAVKVMRTLHRRLGEEAYTRLCYAALSNGLDKADMIYHTIVRALSMEHESLIFQDMHHPAVMRVFELSRTVSREVRFHYEFIRFHELANGVLFARCTPKFRITILVAEHFADRFPMEDFIILNETYHEAAVHMVGKECFLCDGDGLDEAQIISFSETEQMFEKLWKGYFESMTIEERRNPALQRQLFPKRYWKHAVEMEDKL